MLIKIRSTYVQNIIESIFTDSKQEVFQRWQKNLKD